MPSALLVSLTALALLARCSALLPAPAAIASGIAASTGGWVQAGLHSAYASLGSPWVLAAGIFQFAGQISFYKVGPRRPVTLGVAERCRAPQRQ